jgi:hypothetical protein
MTMCSNECVATMMRASKFGENFEIQTLINFIQNFEIDIRTTSTYKFVYKFVYSNFEISSKFVELSISAI